MVQEQFPELKLILSECCCLYVPSNSPEVWAHARKYAHDIIGNLNAGMDTWFDWNLFLDEQGGQNHVGNYCSSPIMLDGNGGYEKRAPYYYIRQISGFIQPGAVRVGYSRYTDRIDVTAFRNPDGTIVGILLNCGDSEEQINLRIKGYVGELKLAPGGIASVLIQEQEKRKAGETL